MKKIYLSFAAAMLAGQAIAVEPAVYPDLQITGLSPDGRYAVSSLYGTMEILDLTTGEVTSFYEGDEGATSYSAGIGNYVSNTGIVLGSMFDSLNAAYYKDGEWHELNVPNPNFSNMANGVTPDGLRICGSVGGAAFSPESENIMLLPAVWNLQENGEYSDAVLLPHPDLDFSGRTPQYITAIAISDDGRTVAGQVRDYSGSVNQPIIYTLDDENNWHYTLLATDLINPNKLEIPVDPGDGPSGPYYGDYMTPEQLAAYTEALNEFWFNGGPEPNVLDYMIEEKAEEYEAAFLAYTTAFAIWAEQSATFYEVFDQVIAESALFEFNSVILSGDGKRYAAARMYEEGEDFWSRTVKYAPALFNLENGEVTEFDNSYNMTPTAITSNYTIVGFSEESLPTNFVANFWGEGADAPETLYSYMQNANANTAAWMEENMVHDYEGWDMATWESFYAENVMVTGIPTTTPDMSLFVTHVENFFEDSGAMTYSYILPAAVGTGVKGVESKELAVKALPGSVLLVNGNAASVEVYDLNGRKAFEVANANGSVATGLNAGIYVVKAIDAKGNSIVRKVRF